MLPRNKDVFSGLGREIKLYNDVDCRGRAMPKKTRKWIIKLETILMLLNQTNNKNEIFLMICTLYVAQINSFEHIDSQLIDKITNSLFDFMQPPPVQIVPVRRRGPGLYSYVVPLSEVEIKEKRLAVQIGWFKSGDLYIKKGMENVATTVPQLISPLRDIIEDYIAGPREKPRFWS